MKTLYLNRRELKMLAEIVDKFPDGDMSFKLTQTDSNGIGSVLSVTLGTYVHDIYGEFTITISDEGNW